MQQRTTNNKSWERPSCNICKNTRLAVIWDDVLSTENEGVYTIVSCTKCQLTFLAPRPQQKAISKYYPKNRYWGVDLQDSKGEEVTDEYLSKNYGELYDIIFAKYKKGSILDIGAGTGGFLIPFQNKGWEVSGVEFSKDAVRYAKKAYGVSLITGELKKNMFAKNSFDVITLNNVLEHLFNPLGTLEIAHDLLKPTGMIIITVPNLKGVGSLLFKQRWYPLQPPIHLYHFTQNSLKQILSVAGFQVHDVNHSFFVHNYYSLFQSFRFLHTKNIARSVAGENGQNQSDPKKTFLKRFGKFTGSALSYIIAKIEPFIKMGEVITVSATKKEL